MTDEHPARRVTLQRHILESQRRHPGASGELSVLLTQVAYAGKIFAHALGRAALSGHLGVTERAFWIDRPDVAHAAREIEAEATAYFVTARLNLDIASVSYLAGYVKPDQPLPSFSLDAVLKAAGKIEEMLAGRFRVKKKGKSPK